MIPASTPAITLPTTRPRCASGVRWATNGISTWAPLDMTPRRKEATKKGAALWRTAQASKAEHGQRRGGEDQELVLDQVGERDEEEQADAVADLGQAGDRPGKLRRDADLRGDRADQRLRVVEVGDQGAGRHGQHGDQPWMQRHRGL